MDKFPILPAEIWQYIISINERDYKIAHKEKLDVILEELKDTVHHICIFVMEDNENVNISDADDIGDDVKSIYDAIFIKMTLLTISSMKNKKETRFAYYNNTFYCISIKNDEYYNEFILVDEPKENKVKIKHIMDSIECKPCCESSFLT